MLQHGFGAVATAYSCLRRRSLLPTGRRELWFASNSYTRAFKAAISCSFTANSSLIADIVSCISFHLALAAASLRSISWRNSVSGAGQGDESSVGPSKLGLGGDEIGIGGDEGNTVETSSGRGERTSDALSLSLSGICSVYICKYCYTLSRPDRQNSPLDFRCCTYRYLLLFYRRTCVVLTLKQFLFSNHTDIDMWCVVPNYRRR